MCFPLFSRCRRLAKASPQSVRNQAGQSAAGRLFLPDEAEQELVIGPLLHTEPV